MKPGQQIDQKWVCMSISDPSLLPIYHIALNMGLASLFCSISSLFQLAHHSLSVDELIMSVDEHVTCYDQL